MERCMFFPTVSLVYEGHKVGVEQQNQTKHTNT